MVSKFGCLVDPDCNHFPFFVCLLFDEISRSKTFEIFKFNGKDFVVCKMKICVILIKDGCVIYLKGRQAKPKGITNV